MGLGFPYPAGRYRPGESLSLLPGCLGSRDMDDFLIRVRSRIVFGCGGTLTLAKRTSLLSRRLYETATIEWGWVFHTMRGGIDPGVVRVRPHDVGFFGLVNDFSSGDETILSPGCDRSSKLARGATLVARCLHEPQPIGNQLVAWRFPRRSGPYRPAG